MEFIILGIIIGIIAAVAYGVFHLLILVFTSTTFWGVIAFLVVIGICSTLIAKFKSS